MKEEAIVKQGVITDIFKGDNFKVKISDMENYYVTCKPSGKIRKFDIKLLLGDRVTVEVTPYDLNKGRITYREK